MGFTYKSRFPVVEFAKRFRADFGKEPRATFFEIGSSIAACGAARQRRTMSM